MRNIYLVVGSYGMGEWDHNEWNVAIYDSEEAAETHADNANKYKGYKGSGKNPYDPSWPGCSTHYYCRTMTLYRSPKDWKTDGS